MPTAAANPNIKRIARILYALRIIKSTEAKEHLLQSLQVVTKPTVVSFVNAHALERAWDSAAFAASLYHSDIVLRDGIGISLVMKSLRMQTGINMNGTDFIPQIISRFKGRKVAICGTVEPYLSIAAEKLRGQGCNIILSMEGFLPPESYIEHVKRCEPDLVILGMGMPKQEAVSMLLAERMKQPVVIVNGGAVFDFLANRFPRAPLAWRCLRLEWLFRLLLEPKRLGPRYIVGGAKLLVRTIRMHLSRQFR